VHELNPNQLKEVATPPFAPFTLFIEFDNPNRQVKKLAKKAEKIAEKYGIGFQTATEPEQQLQFWKLRQATSTLISHNDGLQKSVPLVDAAVPLDRLRELIEGAYSILGSVSLKPGLWGHVGEGSLHFQPHLNLGAVGDRQKVFRILEEYHQLVISLGGTISASAGDGRLRTPFLEAMYGAELYVLLQKVKIIFDPYGTLNPGVKFGTSIDDLKALLRSDYGLDHLYDHLPRS